MTLYLDTSVLVAALTHESGTPRAQQCLRDVDNSFTVSEWSITEFSAALSLKIRTGQLDSEYRARSQRLFSQLISESALVLSVEKAHFNSAAKFTDRHELALRAGDALHLAIASAHDATVMTLDKRMASAGMALGIATRLI